MPATTGTHVFSTTLQVDWTGGVSYGSIAEVFRISGPGFKVGSSNMTNLNSPNAAKEKKPGFIDAGEVSIGVTWTKAVYNSAVGALRKTLNWKLIFPLVGAEVTASSVTFSGHLTGIPLEVPDDDRISHTITIDVTGLPVFTPGS